MGSGLLVSVLFLAACGSSPPPSTSSGSAIGFLAQPERDSEADSNAVESYLPSPVPVVSEPRAVEPAHEPVVRGSLSANEIQSVVRENLDEVRECYDAALGDDPDLAGRVNIRFVISATGTVASTSVVGNTPNSQAAAACVSERLQSWVFPAPRGGGVVIVTYPFLLTPRETLEGGVSSPGDVDTEVQSPAPGRLTRHEIVRVIRADGPAVRHCYQSELARQPGLAGRVTFRFRIAESGQVSTAEVVSNTVGSPKVANCVAARILSWTFPPPQGSMTVSYPFRFQP